MLRAEYAMVLESLTLFSHLRIRYLNYNVQFEFLTLFCMRSVGNKCNNQNPSATVKSIDVINVLIHPTISEEAVTTTIALTCAAYYVNDEAFGQDVDVLWFVYFKFRHFYPPIGNL